MKIYNISIFFYNKLISNYHTFIRGSLFNHIIINVIINLHNSVIFRDIFSLNIRVSSIPVIIVIIMQHNRAVFRYTFSRNMKVSSILVINVIIKQQDRTI